MSTRLSAAWLVAGLCVTAPFAPALSAQEVASSETAAEALATDLARVTANSQARELYQRQKSLVDALDLPDELSSVVDTYLQQVRDLLQKELSNPAMQRDMMQLFARHFTFDEMQELQQFFRTHTGQKFLEKMPDLAGDAGLLAQRRAAAMLPQLDSFTRQLLENVEQYYSGSAEE